MHYKEIDYQNPLFRNEEHYFDSKIAWIFLALAFSALVMSFFLSDLGYGRWAFASSMVMAVFIGFALFISIVQFYVKFYATYVLFIIHWIAPVFPLLMCFVTPLSNDSVFPFGSVLFERPISAGFGVCIMPISISLILFCIKSFGLFNIKTPGIRALILSSDKRFGCFLVFSGFIGMTVWISVLEIDNPVFYLFRILRGVLVFTAFFAGFSIFKFPKSSLFYAATIVVALILATFTGERGYAFIPAGLYLCGAFFAFRTWKKRFMIGTLVFLPLLTLLLVFAAFIGSLRDAVGRGNILEMADRGFVIGVERDSILERQLSSETSLLFGAFRRLTKWQPLIIPAMTPNEVAYRGFSDIHSELKGSFSLHIFQLISPELGGAFYFSNQFLVPYGFPVHVGPDGRVTSNAGFPIAMDGFTRGGWIVAFAYAFIGVFLLIIIEVTLRRALLPHKQILFIMMLSVLCYFAFDRFDRSALIPTVRLLVLELIFCYGIFSIVHWFFRSSQSHSVHRITPR